MSKQITISKKLTGGILIRNYVWESNFMQRIRVPTISFHGFLQKIYNVDLLLVFEKFGFIFHRLGSKYFNFIDRFFQKKKYCGSI